MLDPNLSIRYQTKTNSNKKFSTGQFQFKGFPCRHFLGISSELLLTLHNSRPHFFVVNNLSKRAWAAGGQDFFSFAAMAMSNKKLQKIMTLPINLRKFH